MEIWKDVEGYEGLYQVSNYGKIKKVYKQAKEIILKPTNLNGYLQVRLSNGNVLKNFYIHRLVAKAFIPNNKNKRTINHKNGIKGDNRLSNLEWATHKENLQHAYKHGLKNNDYLKKGVVMIDSNKKVLKEFQSITQAAKYVNGDVSSICKCLNRKLKTHKGYG